MQTKAKANSCLNVFLITDCVALHPNLTVVFSLTRSKERVWQAVVRSMEQCQGLSRYLKKTRLMEAVATVGPVAAAVDATSNSFRVGSYVINTALLRLQGL